MPGLWRCHLFVVGCVRAQCVVAGEVIGFLCFVAWARAWKFVAVAAVAKVVRGDVCDRQVPGYVQLCC